MKVEDIIKEYLRAKGYNALHNQDGTGNGCTCGYPKDFFQCGGINLDCYPTKITCEDKTENGGTYIINDDE